MKIRKLFFLVCLTGIIGMAHITMADNGSTTIAKWKDNLSYKEIIENINKNFPEKAPLNYQRIAYILHTNRKKLQKKLKIT